MNEVKTPKKPLIFYYLIVLALILGLNFLFMPWLMQRTVEEVDYGTFIKMTNNKEIGRVEVQDNQIVFTDKDENKIYKTGRMDDPELVDRLYESGAEFASEIVEQASPFLIFILSWVLPIVIFIGIGQYMTKKLMDHAGGGSSSMAFGMGKSNAKVYVKSSDGIKFADVAGEDEAKENLKETDKEVNFHKDKIKIELKDIQKLQHLYIDIFSEEDEDYPDHRVINNKERAVQRILDRITDKKFNQIEIWKVIQIQSWDAADNTFKPICDRLRNLGYEIINNN